MADVLNRTTRELRRSVNTPEYDPQEWIINPDLAAVADVPAKYWAIEGDAVVPMGEQARSEVDAAEEAAAAEAIRQEAIDLVEQPSGLRTVLTAISAVTQAEIRAIKRGNPREEATLETLKGELRQIIESGEAD